MLKKFKTKFKGLIVIQRKKHKDKRGFLMEMLREETLGKKFKFQILSKSKKNVLRGLHFQLNKPQAKHITVIKGKILDIAVDLRKNSSTFGKVFTVELTDKNCKSIYIPAGFAHAYYSFEKENIIYYKLDNYYAPKFENGILYNDKDLKIKWPNKDMLISKKDKNLLTLYEFKKKFKSI